jgi:hypothetical protein
LRKEMDERLKKEEEERIARRKRVEAIMLRTRGKGSTPSSTPTKVLIFYIITIQYSVYNCRSVAQLYFTFSCFRLLKQLSVIRSAEKVGSSVNWLSWLRGLCDLPHLLMANAKTVP